MTIQPVPCLCGCGQQIKRAKSLPMCKLSTERARRIFREQTRDISVTEYTRAFNRFYGSRETVAAALAAA